MQKRNHQFLIFFVVLLCGLFVLPLTSHAGIIPTPPNNLGLVGYWSFEGTQDTSVDDYSGNGNTGTMTNMDTGTDYVTGYKSGSTALDFDGTNDYVTVPQNSNLDGFSQFTISLWIKQNSSKYAYYFSSKDDGFLRAYNVYVNANGSVGFITSAVHANNQYVLYDTTATGLITYGSWHHVVATFNGSADMKVYVDGVYQSGSRTTAGSPFSSVLDSTSAILIGTYSTYGPDAGYNFNGSIDDARIYSRELSASDIQAFYNQTKATYKTNPKDNLIGYWSFEDATGTTATDFSGNGNTGTLTNMDSTTDWVDGRVGKALDFDGTDDYVDISSSASLNLGSNDFAIGVWIKSDSVHTGLILQKGDGSAITDSGAYSLYVRSTSPYIAFFQHEDGGSAQSVTSTSNIHDGMWHHVYGVKSGATYSIYIDGLLSSSSTLSELNTDSTKALRIGRRIDTDSLFLPFNGQIDEVRIYNTAISATEIQNLYQNSKYTQINSPQNNKLTEGLVGYWTFNGADVDGTTIKDVSSNRNNGTATNGPLPTIGKVGQGYDLDGSDDYVVVASNSSYAFGTGDFTWSIWVKSDSFASGNNYVLDFGANGGTISYQGGVMHYYDATTGVGNVLYTTGFGSGLSIDRWYLLTAVRSGGVTSLYRDGQYVTSAIDGHSYGTQTLNIGRYGGGGFVWNGKIDEVRLYNRALTTAEITRLYNLGR